MDLEKGKFQYSGLRWLYEMELVNDPQLVNNLKLNIFSLSRFIKDVELLFSYQHRQLLVFVDVSWFGKKFLKKRIVSDVLERVQVLLPNLQLRVVTEREILELALERVKVALKGGKTDEKNSTNSKPGSGSDGSTPSQGN